MSFCTQDDVFGVVEPVLAGVFEEFADGREVSPAPFRRISHEDAMAKYGTDKPDLRNPIEMADATETFRGSGFKVFASMIEKDEKVRVRAIPAKGGGSRAFCDRMNSWAQAQGQPGLGYIFFRDGEGAGPVAKNIGRDRAIALRDGLGLADGDAVFFVAGAPSDFVDFAAAARARVGTELGLCETDCFNSVGLSIFRCSNGTRKPDGSILVITRLHAAGGMGALESGNPLDILAYQYDIVCNGVELSSGAIRNHKPEIMYKAFEIAGHGPDVVDEKFGGMINAFKYGAPPHGGTAPGIDRIVMLLADEPNIREVVCFPMNQQAQDLLMGAPATIEPERLRELHLKLDLPKGKKAVEDGDGETFATA